MPRAFTRQIGDQPGVQLNAIIDRTGNGVLGDWDQSAAIVGRFPRGRIDKPFTVDGSNFYEKLGKPTAITSTNLLAEAHSQAYEAVRNGARRLVVARLTTSAAVVRWAGVDTGATTTFSTAAAAGATGTLWIKHLACHADGIKIAVHADQVNDASGNAIATDVLTVRVLDSDGRLLHEVTGSLTAGATNEFGQSTYLPDVAETITDLLEFSIPTGQTVAVADDCYGRDTSGNPKWVTSAVLSCFSEGGTGYGTAEYDTAVNRLRNGAEDFGYIMGGGTRAVALITRLADLAYQTNRQFLLDVPGEYTVAQAVAFANSLGFGTAGKDHYPQIYWAPFKSLDVLNNNVVVYGTSGAQVGFRCARNARTNAFGLADKHIPIAGARGNVGRAMYRNTQVANELTEQQLSDLADARIVPVIFNTYASGSFYAFTDAITMAATKLSYRKLSSVAEMSSFIDEVVARYGRELLMRDRKSGKQAMIDFLERHFSNAYASDWLVEGEDETGAVVKPYEYKVEDVPGRPDAINVTYWLRYNGLIRQIFVQQVIV